MMIRFGPGVAGVQGDVRAAFLHLGAGATEDPPPRKRVMAMETHYTWDIERFPTKTEPVKSPSFSTMLGGRLFDWSLLMYPEGDGSDNSGYVSVYLNLETSDIPETEVWYKLSLIDSFDVKLVMEGSGKMASTRYNAVPGRFGYSKFVERAVILDKRKRLLADGNALRVHCCISNESQVHHCVDHFNIALSGENPNIGMWQLYKHQKHVDVTIKVSDKVFKVHKVVLAARSDVFNAMFDHDLKEKATNAVVIEDIDPAVFEETIRFIYLDVVDHMDKFALGFLSCAEKYHLKRLKALCVSWLSKTLSVDTAADTLVAAHLYNAPFLKVRAIALIAQNLELVMKTAGWMEVLRYGDLMNAICEELVEFVVKDSQRNDRITHAGTVFSIPLSPAM